MQIHSPAVHRAIAAPANASPTTSEPPHKIRFAVRAPTSFAGRRLLAAAQPAVRRGIAGLHNPASRSAAITRFAATLVAGLTRPVIMAYAGLASRAGTRSVASSLPTAATARVVREVNAVTASAVRRFQKCVNGTCVTPACLPGQVQCPDAESGFLLPNCGSMLQSDTNMLRGRP